MEKAEEDLAFMELYRLRDRNNRRFVGGLKRLRELDPEYFEEMHRETLANDRAINELMVKLCK